MKVKPPHLGLRARATLFVLAILVIMAVSMATVAIRSSNLSIAAEQVRAANLVAVSLARAAELAVTVRDEAELKRLANAFLLDDSLVLVRIADQADRTLAIATRGAAVSTEISDQTTAANTPADAIGPARQNGMEASHPDCLFGYAAVSFAAEDASGQIGPAKQIGRVTVGVSTVNLRAAQQQQAGVIVMATLVAVVVAGSVAFVAAGRWSRRLLDLVAASEDIAGGKLDVPLCGHERDEIGQLTSSFEQMRCSLQQRDRTLLELNNGLQDQVRIRTAELEKALHAAEGAARAKTDFLANMSHEIRTPMTAILGFADLLAAPDCPLDERDEHVRTIKRNGEHLLVIINDILDISKLEAGKMTAHLTACDPTQIIAEVRGLLSQRAAESGVPLLAEFPGGSLPKLVSSEPTRLRQILTNLVANALKFTKSGSVTISATTLGAGTTEQSLRFAVIDTGSGMDRSQLDKLFQPFSQVDNSASRVHGGTGLGLAISRGLAKMLGGGITVSSEPGKGSVFTVTISAIDWIAAGTSLDGTAARGQAPPGGLAADYHGAERRGHTHASEAPESQPEPTPGGAAAAGLAGVPSAVPRPARAPNGYRVLLAEDGTDNQRLITLHLKRAGFVVEVVENGKLALETIIARPAEFDVLISDMQMTVMDGYTAARALRARGYLGPILALTAHAMNGDRERCLAAGCDDYATKPIQPKELIEKVTAMAAVSRAIAAGQRSPRHYDRLAS